MENFKAANPEMTLQLSPDSDKVGYPCPFCMAYLKKIRLFGKVHNLRGHLHSAYQQET